MTRTPPPITPVEFSPGDFDYAEQMAQALGYEQTAYTSTSALWGLFCLPENPYAAMNTFSATAPRPKLKPGAHLPPYRGGVIIKTREFGFLFVQDVEDLGIEDTVPRYGEQS